MKHLLYLISLIMIIGCSAKENLPIKIPFEWDDEISNGVLQEKTAMLIPVFLGNEKFYMQFDLAAYASVLYLEEIPAKLKDIFCPIKKNRVYEYEDLIKKELPNQFLLQTLDKKILLDSINIMNYKIDSNILNNTFSVDNKKIIGTLGRDVFKNNCTIDFKKQFIVFDKKLNNNSQLSNKIDVKIYDDYLVFIPLFINDKEYWALFDTGSSMFPLLITKKALGCFNLMKSDFTDSIAINVWGNSVNIYSKEVLQNIIINKKKYVIHNLYMTEEQDNLDFYDYKKSKEIGIIGNQIFLDKEIFIDYKNKKMIIN